MTNEELIFKELQKISGRLDSLDAKIEHLDAKVGHLDEKVERLDAKVERMDDRLDTLTMAHEETRGGVNTLLEWAEECAHITNLPLPKVK